MKQSFLVPPKAILLDMDGILYHGDRCIPEALVFMQSIANVPHCFITNNPIKSPQAVADRLSSMGFVEPQLDIILTTAEATADYLSQIKPNFRYYAIGEQGLHIALSKKGRPVEAEVDFVVVGEGQGIDFQVMAKAINFIVKDGAKLISTNPDVSVDAYVDGKHEIWPGGGALVAPIALAAEVKPVTIGKPFPLLYELAMVRLGIENPADCVMVGDRPDTDILGASNCGMQSALVRTGRFSPKSDWPDGQNRPDWDVDNLDQLVNIWHKNFPGWLN